MAKKKTARKVVKSKKATKSGTKAAKTKAKTKQKAVPRKKPSKQPVKARPASKKKSAPKAQVRSVIKATAARPAPVSKKVAAKPVTSAKPSNGRGAPARSQASAKAPGNSHTPKTSFVTAGGKRPAVPVSAATASGAAIPNNPAKTKAPQPAVQPAPKPSEKKPLKERVTMEFEVRSAPNVLYDLISTPSGFSEWYCDDVDVRGDQYTFKWGPEEEATTMIGRRLGEVIRFHRNDDTDEAAFFEFRIRIDAMTNEVALIVTDHAWPGEVEETRSLWASQIASLLRVLGA